MFRFCKGERRSSLLYFVMDFALCANYEVICVQKDNDVWMSESRVCLKAVMDLSLPD